MSNFKPKEKVQTLTYIKLPVDKGNKTARHWYTARLSRPQDGSGPTAFTIRFRTGSSGPWKWANDQYSTSDGQLLWQAADHPSDDLSFYLHGLASELNVKKETSETPDTLLWSVTAAVPPAKGEQPGNLRQVLGYPIQCIRWFSLVQPWSPWLAPRHGKYIWRTNSDAVSCSFLRNDGYVVVVLAISGIRDVRTIFLNDDEGRIIMSSSNDREGLGPGMALVAVAKSFEIANCSVMYKARRMIMDHQVEIESQPTIVPSEDAPTPQWIEEWYDGLTYCTWNGLGINLTEASVLNAVDSLRNDGIQITNLIIDDNWQDLDNPGGAQYDRHWLSFEANKSGFPNGLRGLTDKIRNNWKNKNLQHIAVWHAIVGYWGGLAPDGKIAKKYKTVNVPKKGGGHIEVIDEPDVYRFYNDFYAFLNESRIDSVKTDAQFLIDEIASAPVRRRLINTYQDSWSIAQLRYFGGKAISCMSLNPSIIFHSQLPTNRPATLLRNSDDFFPDQPDSHAWHIFCNAHNALFTQHLNVIPDWDMFQTSHSWGSYHAAGRCVSGGPIYITDVPGEHDKDLIDQFSATTTTGVARILRPSCVGKSIDVFTSYDEEKFLKVGTYQGRARTGTGILGVFNVSKTPLTELVRLDEFPGVKEDTKYVIRAHTSGKVSREMSLAELEKGSSVVCLDLPVQGWEILSAYPLIEFGVGRSEGAPLDAEMEPTPLSVAVLGLLGKMTGAAAIVQGVSEILPGKRIKISARLKALGVLGIYIADLSRWKPQDDLMVAIFGKPVPVHTVSVSHTAENVLEINVEKAWKEMGLQAQWNNEVLVETWVGVPSHIA
ncbi:MAG: hypothetical protein M1820_003635 [Bogoriella megaspora]|nr:MAG: hypothetical protein M1820_003635 [Bogoriella megaspora]